MFFQNSFQYYFLGQNLISKKGGQPKNRIFRFFNFSLFLLYLSLMFDIIVKQYITMENKLTNTNQSTFQNVKLKQSVNDLNIDFFDFSYFISISFPLQNIRKIQKNIKFSIRRRKRRRKGLAHCFSKFQKWGINLKNNFFD